MKINMITFCLLFFTVQISQAQSFSKNIKLPNTTDNGWSIVPEEDGYTILASATFYTDTGFYFAEWFLKTDLNGELQWIKLIDTIPQRTGISSAQSLTRLKDSSYILSGTRTDSALFLGSGLLIKLDLEGNLIWEKTHGENDNLRDVPIMSYELASGNILNLKWREIENEPTVFAIMKYSSDGDFLWEKDLPINCELQFAYNIVPTDDGNLLFSYSCYTPGPGAGLRTPGVMKIDTSGNMLWDRLLTEFTAGFCPVKMNIQTLPNDGYAFQWCNPEVSINTKDTAYIFGMNADHEKQWGIPFVNNPVNNGVSIRTSRKAENGDIVLCGYNDASFDYNSAAFFARVTPNGELLWQRYLVLADRPWDYPMLNNFELLPDGGMIAVGAVKDSIAAPIWDIWLLKVDEDGCFTPGCTEEVIYISKAVPTEDMVTDLKEVFFKMSPNPATDQVNLDFYNPVSRENVMLKVYSMTGQLMYREILSKGISDIDLTVNEYSTGLYLVVLEQEGRILQKEKLVKQ